MSALKGQKPLAFGAVLVAEEMMGHDATLTKQIGKKGGG
jgi:hypothetical protein